MAKEELDYLSRAFLRFSVGKQDCILNTSLKSEQGGNYEK